MFPMSADAVCKILSLKRWEKIVGCCNLNTLILWIMVHWVWGWGAECNGIISALGRKTSGEVEIGQDAPAEDWTLTLQSHVGILSFMDFYLFFYPHSW